jgi:hypothetical protein
LLTERLKRNNNHSIHANYYFWRTHLQKEIDFLEEHGGKIDGFELKWAQTKWKAPEAFIEAYDNPAVRLINRENFREFLRI